ncbi:abc transporter, putative [Leishmania tarentolae]|uniref:Abc transporter, putative n=1 Tax=Leishmania tarentolae TaxID=5689 RepID=A0A640KCW3_LEITA|nr:abc transporter, putative [Leishmania tarentolae]
MQPMCKGSRNATTRQSGRGSTTSAASVASAAPESPFCPPLPNHVSPRLQALASPAALCGDSNSENVCEPEISRSVAEAAEQPSSTTNRRESQVCFSLALEQICGPHSVESTDGLLDRTNGGPASVVHGDKPRRTSFVSADPLEPYSVITKTSGAPVSLWTQVLALLQRTGQQYMRQKLLIIAEVVSPVLFVVLLIIIDVSLGTSLIPDDVFTIPHLHNYQLSSKDYMMYLCYNDTTQPIKGLSSCAEIKFPYVCDGNESDIPVKGLCYFRNFVKPAMVVKQYLDFFTGDIITVPSLDSIIVHQWMAKKADLNKDFRSSIMLTTLLKVGTSQSTTNRFDSISCSGLLYFAPAANVPAALIEYFQENSAMFEYVYGGVFDTVDEAHAAIRLKGSNELLGSTWGLIIVHDITENFDVQVQLHSSALPPLTRSTVSMDFRAGFTPDGADMFLASGFLSLQQMLYMYFYESRAAAGALANLQSGAIRPYTVNEIYPLIASYPSIEAHTPYLLSISPSLVALVMVMSLLYPFSQITKRVVLEKELCIQESVCIMGLRRSSLWLNFFLVIFLEYVLISILLTVPLCASVAPRSNPFAVFLILLVYSLTLIPLCGLVSAFLSHARMAVLMSPLLYFVLTIPIFAMGTASRGVVLGLSLLSPAALASLLTSVFTAETGGGFQMYHFKSPHFNAEPYLIMLILVLDCVLYLLLMVYFNAVLPQEWGTRKHPLFFLIEPWVWLTHTCGSCNTRRRNSQPGRPPEPSSETTTTLDVMKVTREQHESGAVSVSATETSQDQERGGAVGLDLCRNRDASTNDKKGIGIRISHLCKYFQRNGKRFAAVNNLSWNVYRGEIAVLLGPNGAGKSTTINIITGILAAGSGDCFIEGHSVTQNVAEARHEIGYCPQHNILWPDLTCREHLEFYGKIKGLRGAELEDAVVDILRAVDLEEKVDAIPAQLCGGQRRKLCVAIAFVGRNRVVILDEPTAGMDAAARRHTWSLLRAMTQNHTIMLTTHYMDEADLLGDNIAIVTEGVLQCAGSSATLRQYAGVGYTLRFHLSPIPTQGDDAARQAKVAAVWAELHELVMSHLPDSTLVLQMDTVVEYELRLSADAHLPELLKDMESRGNRQLHIRSYALRAPTLEDVFMRVVEHQIAPSSKMAMLQKADNSRTSGGSPPAPASPLVHHSTSRRTSRSPLHYTMNEPTLSYGNSTEPIDGDEIPIAVFSGTMPTQHQSSSDVFGLSSMDAAGADRGGANGVHLAGVPKHNNVNVMGLKRQGSRSIGTHCHESADGDTSLSAQFPQNFVGAKDVRAAAIKPHACPTPSVQRTTTAAPTGQQKQQQQQSQGNTIAGICGGGISSMSTATAHIDCTGRAPCPPLSEAMGSKSTWQAGAASAPFSAAPVTTTAAAAAWMNPSARDKALYKVVTDHHLAEVWASQRASERWRLWGLQLRGMMYKRFFCAVRDPRMYFFQIICPVLCIFLAMSLQLVKGGNRGTLYLSPSTFGMESEMQVSQCTNYMGDVAHMHEYGHDFSTVSFSDPNFINSMDMTNALLDTWFTHSRSRFMSLQCSDPRIQLFMYYFYPDVIRGRRVTTLLYNTSSQNSLPIAMHVTHAMAYFAALGTSDDAAMATYTMSLTGLPDDSNTMPPTSAVSTILIGTIVLIPFTFLPANPVGWVVKEYESRSRHLQTASGLFHLVYWIGNFLFDLTAYAVSMIFIVVIFIAFQRSEYVSIETIGATIASLSAYGVCYCWYSYMVSFVFTEHTTAQMVVLGVSFFTGFLCVVLVFLLSLLEKTLSTSNSLRWVFRLLPSYSIGEVLLNLALLEQKKMTDPSLTAWSMSITGWPNIYMAVEAPIFAVLTLLWDHPNRRAVTNQLSVWWTLGWCRCYGASWCWWHHPHKVDQQGLRETMPGAVAVEVGDTSAPTSGGNETTELADTETTVGCSDALRINAVIVPDLYRSPHNVEGEKPVGSNTTPPPKTPIIASKTRMRSGSVGFSGPTSMGATGTQQSQQQLVSGQSVSNRKNDASFSEMLYPPPRMHEAEVLLLRQEEDSDVEEERDAVYQVERQHLSKQEAVSMRASFSHLHSPQPKGKNNEENRQKRTDQTLESCDAVRLVDLCKVYDAPHKVAVSALTLSVMHGEVFGFLGTNGAGKSSAMSIITQEQLPTSGRAYVCGNDVVRESRRAAQCLGYCPQFDACLDLLTVTEHLHLYAMVRGVPVGQLEILVERLLTICNLTQYRHVSARQLSGGNRRKLSLAIALIGAPKVLCLDEPTSGMDPLARQLLWRMIDHLSQKCSIILTTHHLEEVEALADCIGIMVDGGLRCFGDLPHLKHKYARGAYELTLRVSPEAHWGAQKHPERQRQLAGDEAGVSPVTDTRQSNAGTAHIPSIKKQGCMINPAPVRRMSISYAGNDYVDTYDSIFQFMLKEFPSALLIDAFNNERYIYILPATRDVAEAMHRLVQTPLVGAKNDVGQHNTTNANKKSQQIVRLSMVFETLRAAQADLGITEYSVSQVSLEQVFLRVCTAEKRLNQNRRSGPSSLTSLSPTFANADICSSSTPRGHPLQQQRSHTSFILRNTATTMGDDGTSLSRRRLSMPSYGSIPADPAAPRLTFAEYRRERALLQLRTEVTEPYFHTVEGTAGDIAGS